MSDSDHASSSPRSRPTAPDRIIVRGLVVETFIGVHDAEREAPQRVRFDVEMDTVDRYAERVRETGAYVSYADIVHHIESRAASGEHVELVESWADDVAAFALGNELVDAVRVTVQKLDIFESAEGVGITIARRRSTSDQTSPAADP